MTPGRRRQRPAAASLPTRVMLATAAALTATAAPAFAQDATALRTRSLAASCAQCHGTDGHVPPGSAMPALAGLPAPYLVEQMQAFKTGARPGSVMPQLAKGYSDAQIALLAAYFAPPAGAPASAPTPPPASGARR